MYKKALLAAIALSLTACASSNSSTVAAPTSNHSYQDVVSSIDRFKGDPVRWGGTVRQSAVLQNGMSKLIIINEETDKRGQPITATDTSKLNRNYKSFIVYLPEIISIKEYEPGKSITVLGSVSGVEEDPAKKGEKLPVLLADWVKLWKKPVKPSCFSDKVLTWTEACERYSKSHFRQN